MKTPSLAIRIKVSTQPLTRNIYFHYLYDHCYCYIQKPTAANFNFTMTYPPLQKEDVGTTWYEG